MSFKALTPYIFFPGCCEEAIAFYQQALGATLNDKMTFADSPDPIPEVCQFPGHETKIMHACINIGEHQVMMSDGGKPEEKLNGFSIALTVETEDDVRKYFAALQQEGQVIMPPEKTFWSPCYGMLTDKFGVIWMLMVIETQGCDE